MRLLQLQQEQGHVQAETRRTEMLEKINKDFEKGIRSPSLKRGKS